jgi:hypothetical protein
MTYLKIWNVINLLTYMIRPVGQNNFKNFDGNILWYYGIVIARKIEATLSKKQ